MRAVIGEFLIWFVDAGRERRAKRAEQRRLDQKLGAMMGERLAALRREVAAEEMGCVLTVFSQHADPIPEQPPAMHVERARRLFGVAP